MKMEDMTIIDESHVNAVIKPPIGIKPRFIHDEQRLNKLRGAIKRYYEAGLPIKIEWIEEYNDLIKSLKERSKEE